MTKDELKKRISAICAQLEDLDVTQSARPANFQNAYFYGAIGERNFEANLANMKPDAKRETTFYSDLNIGEWYGKRGAIYTIKNCAVSWFGNIKMLAEFILCVNWKSWEHHGRKLFQWSAFYATAYELLNDLVYEYYKDNADATSYYWSYMD